MTFSPATRNWPEAGTAYEAQALAFCREWLDGRPTFVLQTSGSTGVPKPTVLTRNQMQASARLSGRTFGLQAGDRALVCLNINYIAGRMMLVRGMELGLRLTVIEPVSNPLDQLPHPPDSFDFAAFVPLQLSRILEDPAAGLPFLNGMKAVLVGGAAVDPALSSRLQAVDAPIYHTYGMTETVSHIAVRRLNGPEVTESFSCLDGVEIGADERSCLWIRSAATNGEVVQTNDVVELLSPNRFRLVGRADQVINSGGVKIHPEPVEALIGEVLRDAGIESRFFVAGLPDDRLGQRLTLFVEKEPIPPALVPGLRAKIVDRFGPYVWPKQIIIIQSFEQTPTAKVDRRKTVDIFIRNSLTP